MIDWIVAEIRLLSEWISKNKDWIFDGVGVAIGAVALPFFWRIFRRKKEVASKSSDTAINQWLVGNERIHLTQRYRQAMLQQVKNFWIDGVLKQSLYSEVLIELDIQERPDAVDRPWDLLFQTYEKTGTRLLSSHGKIVEIFDAANQAMLILGEPGSGKTTTLLELCQALIERAEKNSKHALPVIFNLSSWTRQQSIAQWLVSELKTKYNLRKEIALEWVDNGDLILLFDGFDEVREDNREECVKALNSYRQERPTSIAVCSRILEYEELGIHLKLFGAVSLLPLSDQKLTSYLQKTGMSKSVGLLLHQDPFLKELAKSPLMLSIIILAYHGKKSENLSPFASIESRRKNLFNTYIDSMFSRKARTRNSFYSKDNTIQLLIWLARQMSLNSQSVFLIESLQPTWLPSHQRRIYSISFFLITSLFVSLIGSLIRLVLLEFKNDITGGLAIGLIAGLFVGIVLIIRQIVRDRRLAGVFNEIETVETFSLSIDRATKGLIFGVIVGGMIGLSTGLLLGITNSWKSLFYFVLLISSMFGIFVGLYDGIGHEAINTKARPNQGMWLSFRNAIYSGAIFGNLVMASFWLLGGFADGLILGTIAAGVAFYLYGGRTVIQHFLLRCFLYQNGQIAWDYSKFLDNATERIFLRKVGGGYIFTHRLLLEHFANMDEKAISSSSSLEGSNS